MQVSFRAFEGELFPNGRPQSVYSLDTEAMKAIPAADGNDQLRILLRPGQTFELPEGRGSITFDEVERFAGLSIRTDPGKSLTLVAALASLAGLVASLVIRRRRVFVRVGPGEGHSRTLVAVGGLAKDDDDGMPAEIEHLLTALEGRR